MDQTPTTLAKIRNVGKRYASNWWLPPLTALTLLTAVIGSDHYLNSALISLSLLAAFLASLLGMLAVIVYQAAKRRWLLAAVTCLSGFVILYATASAVTLMFLHAAFNDQPDDFGKDIVIPEGMLVREPAARFETLDEPVTDLFTEAVRNAFQGKPTSTVASILPDLEVLNEFAGPNRAALIDALAADPAWFVTEERGHPYAYRRMVVGGRLQNSLNGFYSSSSVAPDSDVRFQVRVVIGFDGPVFDDPFRRRGIVTVAKPATNPIPLRVVADRNGQGLESYVIVQRDFAALEVFEQSEHRARPATQLAIDEVRRVLQTALSTITNSGGSPFRPVGAGGPSIEVANGMQGGIYHVRALANPGERGVSHLKVFEATQNTPLSVARLGPRSRARIGWSSNPGELFLYQSEITVYEGDWGNYYPARFELWFTPDSGGVPRKLIEDIFRIEGWQR
jgi:hypothetical protein